MTKYEVILYWSAEDEAFIAEVPELAGCAADGVTRQEALANVETVIAEWMETAEQLVGTFPSPNAAFCLRESKRRNPQSRRAALTLFRGELQAEFPLVFPWLRVLCFHNPFELRH